MPPLVAPTLPARFYFKFGQAIETNRSDSREHLDGVYKQVRPCWGSDSLGRKKWSCPQWWIAQACFMTVAAQRAAIMHSETPARGMTWQAVCRVHIQLPCSLICLTLHSAGSSSGWWGHHSLIAGLTAGLDSEPLSLKPSYALHACLGADPSVSWQPHQTRL